MKELSEHPSNKKITKIITDNFSKRFKCNNNNIINFTDNFLSLFNMINKPKLKYFITYKNKNKLTLYFILSGKVTKEFMSIKKKRTIQHIGVIMNLSFNKSNKINCANFEYSIINKNDYNHLLNIAKSMSIQFTQKGGGYSVNLSEQIGFEPTYSYYTEECKPIFTGNLVGGSKCANPNWINCEQPYTFPKCI